MRNLSSEKWKLVNSVRDSIVDGLETELGSHNDEV